ncbi:MAG: prepilin-type N-terminal cleavage/methylation domain-containing protein [Desulfuromonadaceae bacterium]|jgi:prepilin-type N-terminal cleavage/methylation domain-containing protein
MNNRGFSLIELVIVIAIAVIVMAISAPAMKTWLDNSKKNEVAREILSGLRHARSLAITGNQEVTASIDLDNHTLTYSGIVMSFPTTVSLAASADDATWVSTGILSTGFEPRGSCTALLYIRVDNNDNLKVQISSLASGLAKL